MDFHVCLHFFNHRIALYIYSKLLNFTKNCYFSVLLLEGYCFTNFCFTFFPKIIYFMKTLTKLVDSNMEVHGFFELRRDTTGAWSVFRFFNSSWMPRTTDAKIDQKHKKVTFLKILFFFIRLRENTMLTDFLNLWYLWFLVSRVSKFWKIHDSGTGSRPW